VADSYFPFQCANLLILLGNKALSLLVLDFKLARDLIGRPMLD